MQNGYVPKNDDSPQVGQSRDSHPDLRTPLFILRSYLKGLESGVASTPERIGYYIAACQAKADALERLIADLFDYTRLEYFEQKNKDELLDLGVLLRKIAEGVQPIATAKGVALELDCPIEPCKLIGDGYMLTSAVDNLLDNALRHTPAGGRIRISLKRIDTILQIIVEDTGPGIDLDDLPHLFTPLYRGEPSRNRQTGGVGLGLTIAQRIIRSHGGELTAAKVISYFKQLRRSIF